MPSAAAGGRTARSLRDGPRTRSRRWRQRRPGPARREALGGVFCGSSCARSGGLAGAGKGIAYPADGLDRALAELLAQIVDVHFHRIAGNLLAPAVPPL